MLFNFGCTNQSELLLTDDEKRAEELLSSKGYKILTYLGETESYILDQEKIMQPPFMNIWAVQNNSPDIYFGKVIVTYSFIVTDHPLEKFYSTLHTEKEYDFHVNVFLSEGEVVGGISFPVSKNGDLLLGGIYSYDGKTQEEITGLSYTDWLKQWKQKYSS